MVEPAPHRLELYEFHKATLNAGGLAKNWARGSGSGLWKSVWRATIAPVMIRDVGADSGIDPPAEKGAIA